MFQIIGMIVFIAGLACFLGQTTGLLALFPSLANQAPTWVYAVVAVVGLVIFMFNRRPAD
jgi:uncharacterized membrane protein YhhN